MREFGVDIFVVDLFVIQVYIFIYINILQTVLFWPSGPHQCGYDSRMEVKLYSHPK